MAEKNEDLIGQHASIFFDEVFTLIPQNYRRSEFDEHSEEQKKPKKPLGGAGKGKQPISLLELKQKA